MSGGGLHILRLGGYYRDYAHDLDIYGTYSKIVNAYVANICIDENDNVTVHTISGVLTCKDRPWAEVPERLENGFYIINGKKAIVRKH